MKAFWLTVAESTIGMVVILLTLSFLHFFDRSMEFSEIVKNVKNENIRDQIDRALLPLEKYNGNAEIVFMLILLGLTSVAFTIRNRIIRSSGQIVLYLLVTALSLVASFMICYAFSFANLNIAQNKADRTLDTLKTMAKEGIGDQIVYDTLALDMFEDYLRREIINGRVRIVAYIVFVALDVLFAFAFK